MFTVIGFALFMLPIAGVGFYGVKRLIDTVGKMATFILGLSLPFYFITLNALFGVLTQVIQNIANRADGTGLWSFSTFEWISIGCFAILLILFRVFTRAHMRREDNENSTDD